MSIAFASDAKVRMQRAGEGTGLIHRWDRDQKLLEGI